MGKEDPNKNRRYPALWLREIGSERKTVQLWPSGSLASDLVDDFGREFSVEVIMISENAFNKLGEEDVSPIYFEDLPAMGKWLKENE